MKFENYINEDRSTMITTDKIPNLLYGDFSQAFDQYKKGNKIYRHRRGKDEYAVITKTGTSRRSAYARNNYYNLLLNNLQSWKHMPKREIICTFSLSTLKDRSRGLEKTEYLVFPKNGSKIGICPSNDIWFSFDDVYPLDELDLTLEKIFNSNKYDSNWNDFVKKSKTIDINKEDSNYILVDFMLDYFKSDISLVEYLNKMLDPKKNGFKLSKVNDFKTNNYSEVWTDSTCLMVNLNFFETEFINLK